MSRRKKKTIDVFNISFLDLLSGALGAVIILFITVPKNQSNSEAKVEHKNECIAEKKIQESCLSTLTAKDKVVQEQKKKEAELVSKIEQLQTKLKSMVKKEEVKTKPSQKSGVTDLDVGFKFKGKNLVFLVDVSGSMMGDKLGQVKAGLKMLIASMKKDFQVDIVYFPHSNNRNYYALWGQLQSMHKLSIKEEVYEFLSDLTPRGMTPTREALKYALRQYPELTDIVLLSDGSPTIAGTSKLENYQDVIKDVNWHNGRGVQINTIGVGRKTFSNRSSKLYKFLKELSSSTNGFYYGF